MDTKLRADRMLYGGVQMKKKIQTKKLNISSIDASFADKIRKQTMRALLER
ncbi:MAG: hypothetical protein ACI8ZB_005453 [Desulforhopalus sp.]|jgi:hypothetical protein